MKSSEQSSEDYRKKVCDKLDELLAIAKEDGLVKDTNGGFVYDSFNEADLPIAVEHLGKLGFGFVYHHSAPMYRTFELQPRSSGFQVERFHVSEDIILYEKSVLHIVK